MSVGAKGEPFLRAAPPFTIPPPCWGLPGFIAAYTPKTADCIKGGNETELLLSRSRVLSLKVKYVSVISYSSYIPLSAWLHFPNQTAAHRALRQEQRG